MEDYQYNSVELDKGLKKSNWSKVAEWVYMAEEKLKTSHVFMLYPIL